jgi:hypothetical protein
MKNRMREFMATFDSVIHGTNGSSSPAVIISGDLYLNLRLGLAFERPKSWYFNDVQEMGEIGAGQLLNGGITLGSFFSKGELAPLVSISEVPHHDDDPPAFAPAVSVFASQVAEGKNDPLEIAWLDASGMRVVTPGYVAYDAPSQLTISGWPAARYTAGFEFHHVELPEPVPVRMEYLYIVHDTVVYTFRMYDAPMDGRSRENEYLALRESIRLA